MVKAQTKPTAGAASLGIDLGLKTCATTSGDDKIEGRIYRALEQKLGLAQRAKKRSRTLVRNNAAIFVGNMASAQLVKTKMAKSALDAGWCQRISTGVHCTPIRAAAEPSLTSDSTGQGRSARLSVAHLFPGE